MRVLAVVAILLVPAVAALIPVEQPFGGIQASDVVPRTTEEAEVQPGSEASMFASAGTGARAEAAGAVRGGSGQPDATTVEWAESAASGAPGIALPASPMGRLLANLAAEPGAAGLHKALLQYRRDLNVAPPSGIDQFEENSSVSYSHDIGDVDRDGVGDLALDVYCTAVQGCPDFTLRVDTQSGGRAVAGTYCSEPHILATVSGRDGRLIREQPLDIAHTVPPVLGAGCAIEFVVGTLPLGDGTNGILVYRIGLIEEFVGPERIEILHDLRLIDPKTGEPLWSQHEEGYYAWASSFLQPACTRIQTENLVLNPLVQQLPHRGLSPVSRDFEASLFVQGVGFNATLCRLLADPVGITTGLWVMNQLHPVEWMERIVPKTAEQQWQSVQVQWRTETFQPEEAAHSVLPRFLYQAPLGGTYPPADLNWDINQVVHRHDHYWAYQGCCFDLNGDGQPDLAATTLEWSDTPTYNTDELYGLRSRLVAFDGSNGERLYEQTLVDDTTAPQIEATIEALGDTDGDGTDDIAVHVVRFHPTFEHVLSIRGGGDGAEHWRIANPRDLDILNVGDADQDGGNDLLLIEWPDWEGFLNFGRVLTTPFANVTHHPLKVFSGANGDLVWRGETYAAAVDIALLLANLRANGIIDLDNDGVAEVPVDDPTMLPDRSVIHRLRLVEPSTGKSAFTIISAGAFALPALSGDSDGDGRDDLALFNGDINDLWLTVHDADGGDALWARRLVSPRLSSTTSALPTLRMHDIDAITHAGDDLVLNFQMSYTTGGSLFFQSYLSQQILGMNGHAGNLVWSTPQLNHTDADVVEGASPASELFAQALERQAHLMSARVQRVGGLAIPGMVAFAGAAALAFLVVRRLRL